MNEMLRKVFMLVFGNKKNNKNEEVRNIKEDIRKYVDLEVNNDEKSIRIIIKKQCKIEDFYNEIIKNNIYKLEASDVDILNDFLPRWIENSSGIVNERMLCPQTIYIICHDKSFFSISTIVPNFDRLIIDERKKDEGNNIKETQIDVQNGIKYCISRWNHDNNGSTGNVRFYNSEVKGKNSVYMEVEQAKKELFEMLYTLEKTKIGREYVEIIHEFISKIDNRNAKNDKDVPNNQSQGRE